MSASHPIPRLVITPGEPAGIGPDIALQLACEEHGFEMVVVADPEVLRQRAEQLGLAVRPLVREQHFPSRHIPGELKIVPVSTAAPVVPGQLEPRNAEYVLECLRRACDGCLRQEYDALITGPVQKGVINDAGIPFTGHTEFLAEQTGSSQAVMMLAVPGLRVALATTHVALSEISAHITQERIERIVRILHRDLRLKFGRAEPRIRVCGLNPHAGEGGHLGREEIEILEPVLDKLRAQGWYLEGPVPADTAFVPGTLDRVDVVLAMYHDQGLPVLKHLGFGEAVNITLGLPIIRISVDHGTALELAGSGQAQMGSLRQAVHTACTMVQPNFAG